jgi:hypothetical protein
MVCQVAQEALTCVNSDPTRRCDEPIAQLPLVRVFAFAVDTSGSRLTSAPDREGLAAATAPRAPQCRGRDASEAQDVGHEHLEDRVPALRQQALGFERGSARYLVRMLICINILAFAAVRQ